MSTSSSLTTLSVIPGFRAPLPNVKLIHPGDADQGVPVHWLRFGSETLGGDSANIIIISARMFREYQVPGPSMNVRVCFSRDGIKPDGIAMSPQSTLCDGCKSSKHCNFGHALMCIDEASGYAGIWTLRGVSGIRWATLLSQLLMGPKSARHDLPLRVTVKPELMLTRGKRFTVPSFAINTKNRLTESAKATAIERVEATYDLTRFELVEEEPPETTEKF